MSGESLGVKRRSERIGGFCGSGFQPRFLIRGWKPLPQKALLHAPSLSLVRLPSRG